MWRSEREAKVQAALNHPHIAAIYGVEHASLVMELVGGYARRVSAGDQALRYARQT